MTGEFCPLAHNCSSSTEFDPNGSISFTPTGLQTVGVDLKVWVDASFQSVGTGVHLPTDPKLLLLIPVNSCTCLCGNISKSKRIVNTNRNECIVAKKKGLAYLCHLISQYTTRHQQTIIFDILTLFPISQFNVSRHTSI